MKRYILTLSGLLLALTLSAQATLIGRRGCSGGVENSVEAYRAAIDRGFKMIEGHVRLTADSVFVTSHDGKTARLGGALTVEKSSLSDLKKETYAQTREDSVRYTGAHIATVAEFLDICRVGGVTAVLHLKNIPKADDTSRLPELVSLIDSVSSRPDVMILTSSPEYARFIRKNYPDLPLMLQVEKKWAELHPLAVELGVPVDLEVSLVTPEMLALYGSTGTPVCVWTVNDPAQAALLEKMGIAYIITDTLVPGK
ncbi:MAG: hypothetical protein K2K55_10075 [Duncaniella sp.]|nr:hypothetical protein [Duncaniella sp.]